MEKQLTTGSSIRAICFDYYGTLVHTRNGEPFVLIDRWLKESIGKKGDLDFIERVSMSFAKERARFLYHMPGFYTGKQLLNNCYSIICHKYQIETQKELFMEYVKHVFTDTVLYESTEYVLEKLRKKYLIGLVTNADNDILYESLHKHVLTFDFIVTSEMERCNKPGKEIFQKALKCAKLPAHEILMVGDSWTEDILPSRELGMHSAYINRKHIMQDVDNDILQITNIWELLDFLDINEKVIEEEIIINCINY